MTKNRHSSCPFWSPTSGNCKISNEGLFIPLDDHIDIFCKSDEYSGCEHFCVNSATGNKTVCNTVSERRRSDRHSGFQEIKIIQSPEYTDQQSSHLSAHVVDFSENGIRLLAATQLDRDSTVTCALDDRYPEHLRSAAAMIRWCRPLRNNGGYQAGLSFRDSRISIALSSGVEQRPV